MQNGNEGRQAPIRLMRMFVIIEPYGTYFFIKFRIHVHTP